MRLLNSLVAASGLDAPITAPITATPEAPDSMTGSTFSMPIPPMATAGNPGACSIIRRNPSGPIGTLASALLPVAYMGPTPI